ncbi:annexin A9 [Crotalus tigris]|uniref:annexin A9 n=1 Tax=Crotalus tigris TaxID=88082 RepID=UPI00192F93A0|nr:annexin A9 [Crotalus tigris]XP_039219529.1 annexin A9 [Crotalus tigris]
MAEEILEQLPLAEKVAVWGTLGTIRPHLHFDAAKDAQTFFEVISGEDFDSSWSTSNSSNSRGRSRVCKLLVWGPRLKPGPSGPPKGVNCRVIIDLLTSRSSEHRQQIAEAFLDFTQQGLLKTLEAVMPSRFETIIRALLRPAAQNDAHEIQAGLQSLEVESLIEIVSTQRTKQLQETLAYYKQDFKSDLETDIACGTTGGFQELLLALIKGERERHLGLIDYVLIRQDSKALADAAAGGLEQSTWVRILAQRSPEHLRRVFSWYQELTGNSVEETMEKHFQGDFREAGLTLVSLLRNTPLYFAIRLHSAIKEGHNPRTAVRIMVSRSETDLLSIRAEFKRRYGVSLYSFIEMETQDEYQAALLGLCKAEDL